jgi:hypothetical protein
MAGQEAGLVGNPIPLANLHLLQGANIWTLSHLTFWSKDTNIEQKVSPVSFIREIVLNICIFCKTEMMKKMLKISIHTNHLLILMCINKKLLLESKIHTHLYVHLQKNVCDTYILLIWRFYGAKLSGDHHRSTNKVESNILDRSWSRLPLRIAPCQ